MCPVRGTRARPAREPLCPSIELALFACRDGLELPVGDAQRVEHLVVEDAGAALTDRAHRELGLSGGAQLAHDDDVERRAEGISHLDADRHAAAGESDDDRVRVELAPAC